MSLIQLDLKPSQSKLRQFGELSLVMLSLLGLLMTWRWDMSKSVLAGFVIAGLAVYILSRISTKLVWPLYAGLMLAGFPIGWLVSHLVMALFFFGILLPTGLFFRMIGRDALHRKPQQQKDSYWVRHSSPDSIKRYFQQF
jgi:hypothetical protein